MNWLNYERDKWLIPSAIYAVGAIVVVVYGSGWYRPAAVIINLALIASVCAMARRERLRKRAEKVRQRMEGRRQRPDDPSSRVH